MWVYLGQARSGKVVNEKIDWSGCARFTDKDGNPLKGLKAGTKPK